MKKIKLLLITGLLVFYTSFSAYGKQEEKSKYLGDLGVIVVTPDYFPLELEDASPQVRVISHKEIKRKQADTLNEVLMNEPGIFEISERGTMGSLSTLSMRTGGGSANEVLVLIDGIPLNSPADGQVDLSEISTDYIERIEIMRGGSSYMYGGNSVGGVVNVITRKPVADSFSVRTKLGAFNQKSLNLSGSKYYGENFLYISLDGKNIDGWRDNSDFQEAGVFVKAGQKKINASFKYVDNEQGLPGLNNTLIDEWDGDKELVADAPDAVQKKQMFDTTLNVNTEGQKIQLAYMNHRLNYNKGEDFWPEYNDTDWQKLFASVKTKTSIKGLDFGIEGEYSIYDKKDYINPAYSVDKQQGIVSLLGQKKTSFAGLENIISLRYDSSKWGGVLSPRLSFLKKFHLLKVNLSFAQAFNPPDFNALYWKGGYGVGNPELESEMAETADIGIEWRHSRFLVNTSLFYSILKDKIAWALDETISLWKPQNLDKVQSYGLENEVRYFILSNLELKMYYSYMTSQVKNNDWDLLRYTPQHKVGVGVNYSPLENLTISMNSRSQSVAYSSDGEAGTKIEPHTVIDVNILKKINDLKLYLNADNIFNTKYLSRRGYPLPGIRMEGGINLEIVRY